jgi:hypothetical protein
MGTEKTIKVDASAEVEFEPKGSDFYIKIKGARLVETVNGKDVPLVFDRSDVLVLTGSGKDATINANTANGFVPKIKIMTDNPIMVEGPFVALGGKQTAYVDTDAVGLAMMNFHDREIKVPQPQQKPDNDKGRKPARKQREPQPVVKHAIIIGPEQAIDSALREEKSQGQYPAGAYTFSFKNNDGKTIKVAAAEGGRIDFRTENVAGNLKPSFTLFNGEDLDTAKLRLGQARANVMQEVKNVLEKEGAAGRARPRARRPARPGAAKPQDDGKDNLGIPDDISHGDVTINSGSDKIKQGVEATIPLGATRSRERERTPERKPEEVKPSEPEKNPEAPKPPAAGGPSATDLATETVSALDKLSTDERRFLNNQEHADFKKKFDALKSAADTMKSSIKDGAASKDSIKAFHTSMDEALDVITAITSDSKKREKKNAEDVKKALEGIKTKLDGTSLKRISAIDVGGVNLASLGVSGEQPTAPAGSMDMDAMRQIAAALGITGGDDKQMAQNLAALLKPRTTQV